MVATLYCVLLTQHLALARDRDDHVARQAVLVVARPDGEAILGSVRSFHMRHFGILGLNNAVPVVHRAFVGAQMLEVYLQLLGAELMRSADFVLRRIDHDSVRLPLPN